MAVPAPRYPSTCLSEKPHDGRVSDVTLHFSGCLPVAKRKSFFNGLPEEAQQRIIRRHDKVASLREKLETVAQDSNAGSKLKEFKMAMTQWRTAYGRPSPYSRNGSRAASSMGHYHWVDGDVDADIKAPVICFKDGMPHDLPGVPHSFPNQKVTVQQLLTDDKDANPLMQPCEDGMVRYFHLPANNMKWVEEAIARYYHEERPDTDDFMLNYKLRRSRTKTEMLLRPEFWQGQRNFDDSSEVHARHMHPSCDLVWVDPVSTEPVPKNMVLYMPYLHWETDRGRMLSSDCAKKASEHKLVAVSEIVAQARRKSVMLNTESVDDRKENIVMETPTRKKALGELLFRAAVLLEAMEFHTEEQLTFRYLHERPPLHPRRTLDQSYYGALKSTRTRDRDQVVYRATTAEAHGCLDSATCRQCADDIRKVPRLIMVDQLWLWILDENTVISSFPRRWGKNRPDPSAVHKCLRTRLLDARKDEISSAYDLALIIIDECSRVFFDRSKPNDREPNLIEMFADSIRAVSYNQTAAFDQFLVYTHLASTEYKKHHQSAITTQNTLLNINPEGNLLKEVKDIMDEITIILRIQEQQQTALEQFVKNIRLALVPRTRLPALLSNSYASSTWETLMTATAATPLGDEGLSAVSAEAKQREHWNRQKAKATLSKADHLVQAVQDRKLELNTLMENARTTSSALKDLLTLKQQQAGVIEAREAVMQGRQTLKQGQSIMIFTVVTIVFLPLSFFATLFGMNAAELNDGHYTLVQELILMLPISIGIIFLSFLLAFSRAFANDLTELVQSSFSFVANTALTWLAVNTGAYMLGRDMAVAASRLRDREAKITGAWKAEVRRKKSNIEKLRAAAAMRAMVVGKDDAGVGGSGAGAARRDGGADGRRVFSPYVVSPRPPGLHGGHGAGGGSGESGSVGKGLGVHEYDVELGQWRDDGSRVELYPQFSSGR